MSLGEVITTVIETTGRMDKETYVRNSIDAIIRMLAALKDHPETLVDAPQTVSNSLLIHTIDLTALVSPFRKVAYIRPASKNRFLTSVNPRNTMLAGKEVVNCYYQRGTDIIVRLGQGAQTTELVFGYYAHPVALVNDAATNWVLDLYQDVVIDLLVAKVLRVTGNTKDAAAIESGTAIRLAQIIETSSTSDTLMGQ